MKAIGKTVLGIGFAALIVPLAGKTAPIGIKVETLATEARYLLTPAVGPFQTVSQTVPGTPPLFGGSGDVLPPGSDVQTTLAFGGSDEDTMIATTTQTWQNGNDLSYDATFSSGRPNNYKYLGATENYFKVTNNTAAQQFLTYDFELTDMFAEFEYAYGSETGNPFDNTDLKGAAGVKLFMELGEEGKGVLYEAEYEVWAYRLGGAATYREGTQKNIFIETITPKFDFGNVYGYRLDLQDVNESIDLGLFSPGASRTLYSAFSLRAIHSTFETKIAAGAADPGFVPDRIRLTGGVPPSPVPLPASAWLLIAGIGSLLAFRRLPKG